MDTNIDSLIRRQLYITEKYQDGKDIDEQDNSFIDELRSIGIMNKGISLRRMKITAKPTQLGLKIYNGFKTNKSSIFTKSELDEFAEYFDHRYRVCNAPVVINRDIDQTTVNTSTERISAKEESHEIKHNSRFDNIIE